MIRLIQDREVSNTPSDCFYPEELLFHAPDSLRPVCGGQWHYMKGNPTKI